MRSSIQLDEVLNLIPKNKVIKYVNDLEAIVKKLFTSVVNDVDDASNEDVLKKLNEFAEVEQTKLREDAFKSCKETYNELFEMNAIKASTRNASRHSDLEVVRRRNVEMFRIYIGRSYHGIDDAYQAQVAKVQQLINHYNNAGYGLAQAIFVQKTAFSKLQDQAEILFEVGSFLYYLLNAFNYSHL